MLLDINMPVMDGLTLLTELRERQLDGAGDHRLGLWRHDEFENRDESRRLRFRHQAGGSQRSRNYGPQNPRRRSPSCARWTGSAMAPNARGTIFRAIFRRISSSCWPPRTSRSGPVRRETVAVLFVDIVAFTRMAEDMAPENVLALLREFHARMTAEIFASGGTVEQYMGDGMFAVFGVHEPSPDDAANALNCAERMLEALERWNCEREKRARRRSTSASASTTDRSCLAMSAANTACRSQRSGTRSTRRRDCRALTRSLDTPLVVGDAVVQAIQASSPKTPRSESADWRIEANTTYEAGRARCGFGHATVTRRRKATRRRRPPPR